MRLNRGAAARNLDASSLPGSSVCIQRIGASYAHTQAGLQLSSARGPIVVNAYARHSRATAGEGAPPPPRRLCKRGASASSGAADFDEHGEPGPLLLLLSLLLKGSPIPSLSTSLNAVMPALTLRHGETES